MFLQLVTALLFTSVSADEVVAVVKESRQTKVVEEFDESCYDTGYTIKGIIWSSCKEGRSVIKGCITPSGQKVELGMTYVDGRAEFLCLLENDEVILLPQACVFKGNTYAIGSTFRHDKFYYKCVQYDDYSIAVVAYACADSCGGVVSVGDEYVKRNFIFKCDMHNGKLAEVGVKCLIPTGVAAVRIGERFSLDGYTYECKKKGKRSIKTEVVGCADPFEKFIELGQRYPNGPAIMECQVDPDDPTSLTHTVVGCHNTDHRSGKSMAYNVGDRFYAIYTKELGYVMECAFERGSIRHKPVQCIYHTEEIDYHLSVGCAAPIGHKLFICQKISEKSVMVRLKTLPKLLSTFLTISNLQLCEVVQISVF